MLQYKSTTIISELQKYFGSKEKAIRTLFSELHSLKISDKQFDVVDKSNTRHRGIRKFILLILFSLFEIKDISHYRQSSLFHIYKCGKDTFYRFVNNPRFDRRKFSLQITSRLICRVEKHSYNGDNNPVRCLIADDTDLPKCGRRFELLSRIYSHVTHSFNYGFKALVLGYHDGKSFFGLDFSLHGEKGGDMQKPYGLTKQQLQRRFHKKRKRQSNGQSRVNEYFEKKTSMLITMIRMVITKGIRFDYLLTDSWFTNIELLKFIVTRRIKCHFLGTVKNGNTKYKFKNKKLTFKEILNIMKHSRKAVRSKKLNCDFYEADVELKNMKIKLFFCRMTKKSGWHGMLTTNTELNFEKAYEIYSTRWCIEVFFRECKQYLRMGKCESRDFDAQIAATTLCILQYNLLITVKRFEDYESLGELFRSAKAETLELTVKERIWGAIIKITTKMTKYFNLEPDFVSKYIFAEDEELTNILNLKTILHSD
jgi:hypothetical protein